jgi:hypothetical protein
MSLKCTRKKVADFLKETHFEVKSNTDGLDVLKYLKATVQTTEQVLSSGDEPSPDVLLHAFIRIVNLACICEEQLPESDETLIHKVLDKYSASLDAASIRFKHPASVQLIESMQECVRERKVHASPLRCLSDLVMYKGSECRCDSTGKELRLQDFLSEEAFKMIQRKAETNPLYQRLLNFFPTTVQRLRSVLFDLVQEIGQFKEMDISSVFKLMTDERVRIIWTKVGERVWGRANADFWDVVISDLTADKNAQKSLLSMVLFMTYYEDVEGILLPPAKEEATPVEEDPQPEVNVTQDTPDTLDKLDTQDTPDTTDTQSPPAIVEPDEQSQDGLPSLNSRLHAWVEANKNTRNIPPLFTKLTA